MSDRARLSKLKTWTESSPPGSAFLGSADFPPGLVAAVQQFDPVGLFSRELECLTGNSCLHAPSSGEQKRIVPLMKRSLQGKRILNMSGAADKLVPYKCSVPFLNWLKLAISKNGWFSDGKLFIEDLIFDGVGHNMTEDMVKEVLRFLKDLRTNHVSDAQKEDQPVRSESLNHN